MQFTNGSDKEVRVGVYTEAQMAHNTYAPRHKMCNRGPTSFCTPTRLSRTDITSLYGPNMVMLRLLLGPVACAEALR